MNSYTNHKLIPMLVASAIAFVTMMMMSTLVGCESTSGTDVGGPNDLGGEVNLELTRVGQRFDTWISLDTNNPAFDGVKDSVNIVKNEGGIVTFDVNFEFDTNATKALDTLVGTEIFPDTLKRELIDLFLARFGATLDTSDKDRMKIHAQLITKITSEGVQEFFSSGGDLTKPFTVVKYNMNVGDSWTFKNKEGVDVRRTVVSKSTSDDYPIAFWLIKVMMIEETKVDPVFDKVTYIANHKFGVVGVKAVTKNGKKVGIGILPPTL